ncbi:hypothetical protein PV327_006329 [Microctonus hyperodae]|uniref:PH domain-containing protein n=1 Tax=Microctonus hyperodae TaxID=165561 RepID=A0AA39F430_MICHY|nr:hypothetical protein PV327_006329 [Microctonus hyperodae]
MLQAVRLLTELTSRPVDYRRDSEDTMNTSRQNLPAENSVQFREMYKNGWLRKTDKTDKELSRFWVAFCVHDDMEPKLEGFSDQKQAATHLPFWSNSLRGIQHLSPTLCATSRHDYEFCINFHDDRVIRLAAPTYQGMLDWVNIITRKLTEMKILRPKENVYSRGPERIATRDPTSPLPPPPPLSIGLWNPEPTRPNNIDSPSVINTDTPSNLHDREDINNQTAAMIFTFQDVVIDDDRLSNQSEISTRNRSTPVTMPSPHITTTAMTSSNNETSDDTRYESIFLASSSSSSVDESPSIVGSQMEPSNDQYAALIEYRSSGISDANLTGQVLSRSITDNRSPPITTSTTTTTTTTTTSSGSEVTSTVFNSAPPARQLTLREKQVLQLKREMSHFAGVRLHLGRRDCKDGIAFVDTFGSIWVAGWKCREHPLLYNVLHVGDMIISVAGIIPTNANAIKDIIKGITTPRIEVIVRRLPFARAMILTKPSETDDFGLEVNGNELSGVNGIALISGLSPLAEATDPTVSVGSNTTWTLTEVNGRPLNIFDGCANERLSAIGRDISIVVQPTDLVASLRKKLRAIRGYKNFILQ